MRNMTNNGNELKEKLREKLREIFQFESEDLDFGIYRIMNCKRKEIEEFIEKELIEEIRKQLELVGEEEIRKIKEEFEKVKQKIKENLGESAFENGELKEEFRNTPLGKEYYEKKKQVEEIKISEDLEREIYNHLINFFSRYYDKGDFISKRRYGKNEKYIISYNGEEVLLYWANKDQYYIKTTEYFRKYTFKVKGLTVNFRVIEAEEEKGNAKAQEKKFFVLNEKIFDFNEEKRELNIYFEYRGLTEEEEEKYKHGQSASQDKINEEIVKILEEKIPQGSLARLIFEKDPNSKNGKTYIENHLSKYTKRNTTDYFIHKDLKGFLERELDFYIKNEFLQLEDLQVLEKSGYFDKLRLRLIGVRAFRKIALKIIEFLAQIENFQKKIWEKKKFVIDTHYVITLDKIKEYAGEEFLESILDEILRNFGFYEVKTLGLVSAEENWFGDGLKPVKIKNPLSVQHSYLRTSLIPELLQVVAFNVRRGENVLKFYERGRVFGAVKKRNLPLEIERISAVCGGVFEKKWDRSERMLDFYDLKSVVDEISQKAGGFDYKEINKDFLEVGIEVLKDGNPIGWAGLIKKEILDFYKIPYKIYAFEFDMENLVYSPHYVEISEYPPVYRHLSVVMPEKSSVKPVIEIFRKCPILVDYYIMDVYKGQPLKEGEKSITFNLKFQSFEKTLSDKEVNSWMDRIISEIKQVYKIRE